MEAAVAPYWRACATDPRSRAQVHAKRPAAVAAADTAAAAVGVPADGIRRRADGCLPHRCSHVGEGGHPLHAAGSAGGRATAVAVDDSDDDGSQTLGCSELRCWYCEIRLTGWNKLTGKDWKAVVAAVAAAVAIHDEHNLSPPPPPPKPAGPPHTAGSPSPRPRWRCCGCTARHAAAAAAVAAAVSARPGSRALRAA